MSRIPKPQRNPEKLPIWAQKHIQNLTKNLEDAYRRLEEGPADSNAFLDPYGNCRPLGIGSIEFRIGDDRFNIWVDPARNQLRIMSLNHICPMVVLPNAANTIYISTLPR